MNKKLISVMALCLAAAMTFSACSGGGITRVDDSSSDGSSTAGSTEKPEPESSSPETEEVTSSHPENQGASVSTDRSDFVESGSIISLVDDELSITRLGRDSETSMGGDDWTVLVYMCGTDLESEGYAATTDLLEAIEAEYSDNVNIIYQTGGTNAWYDNIIDSTKIQRYENIKGDIMLVDEQPIASMGDPDTLADFISWGAENYPAENMGLVFWNHGGGSISGVCFDERYDYDSLSLTEIDKALRSTFDCMTEKFEFIGFDACLMSTLETANILVPYANYMYASQETEPGGGWDYTALMDQLAADPASDGVQLGMKLCDSYYEHCKEAWAEDSATLSVVDLSKLDELLLSFNETAQQMYESDKFTDIVKCIKEADNFGGNNRTEGYTNMVDLGGILEAASEYCPNAEDTIQKLESTVSYMKNGYQHKDASGLAVYYPLAVQGSTELSVFADVCPSTYYLAFIDKVAYGTTGSDVTQYENDSLFGDWLDIWDIDFDFGDYSTNTDTFADIDTSSTIPVSNVYFDDDGIYSVAISDFSNFSYAACSLFLEDYDGSSIYLGSDDEVLYDWDNGIIQDNFDGTWVSLDDGQPLPIEIVDKTDDYSVYTCSILLNGEYTNLRIEYDWNKSEWNILGAWDGIDYDTGMAAKDIIQLQDGDVIQPVYYYIYESATDYFAGDEYVINGEIELTYQMLPAADYSYSITLYDIYGNWYFTPTVIFTIEEDGSLYFYPEDLEGGGASDSGTVGEEYCTCEYCSGAGCDYCGYYGYLLLIDCTLCDGYGCEECDWYGNYLCIACEYCNGYGCDYCDQYY
ncbi:MAG: hypothetical protein IJZ95_03215 [Oscillospiraceae bacterium]|nr:hypothetical protein [Oscillospiraceae bacterium]